jgi:hypothetical protein
LTRDVYLRVLLQVTNGRGPGNFKQYCQLREGGGVRKKNVEMLPALKPSGLEDDIESSWMLRL